MNDQGDTSQSLGPGHPLQSSAEDGERISATVPIAPAHRPLKFRAWDTEKQRMCYDGVGRIFEYHDCMDHPIMQFSGLQDKHRKDIYEGDIVRRSDALPMNGRECVRIPMAPHRVFFSEGAFRLRRSSKSTKFPLHSSVIRQNGIEVIGNIYENPELLR